MDLRNIDFENRHIQQTNFDGATLTNSRFINTRIIDSTFKNTDLTNTAFSETHISSTTFDSATLHNTKFTNSNLTNVNLTNIIHSLSNENLLNRFFTGGEIIESSIHGSYVLSDVASLFGLGSTCPDGTVIIEPSNNCENNIIKSDGTDPHSRCDQSWSFYSSLKEQNFSELNPDILSSSDYYWHTAYDANISISTAQNFNTKYGSQTNIGVANTHIDFTNYCEMLGNIFTGKEGFDERNQNEYIWAVNIFNNTYDIGDAITEETLLINGSEILNNGIAIDASTLDIPLNLQLINYRKDGSSSYNYTSNEYATSSCSGHIKVEFDIFRKENEEFTASKHTVNDLICEYSESSYEPIRSCLKWRMVPGVDFRCEFTVPINYPELGNPLNSGGKIIQADISGLFYSTPFKSKNTHNNQQLFEVHINKVSFNRMGAW